jgi:hypothetical protein
LQGIECRAGDVTLGLGNILNSCTGCSTQVLVTTP